MKRLPNIKLTKRALNLILRDNVYDYGGEAVLCRNNNPHTLYKIFCWPVDNLDVSSLDFMTDNKLNKIKFYYNHHIEGTIKPLSTLEYNGEPIGYEQVFDPDNLSMFNQILTQSELLQCIDQTKLLLEYFATKDITYGDVTPDNILFNRKKHKACFCDIDNTRVGNYPIDIKNTVMSEYVEIRGRTDETADAYMHNMLTLEELCFYNQDYRDIVHKLRTGNIPSDLDPIAKQIVESMRSPKKFTGEFISPYVKRKIE